MWESVNQFSALLGVLTLAFAVGYNWRRVTVLEETHASHVAEWLKHIEHIEVTYARKDMLDLEIKAIRSRLDYITKVLERVDGRS